MYSTYSIGLPVGASMMMCMCVEIHEAKIRGEKEMTNILLNGDAECLFLIYISTLFTA